MFCKQCGTKMEASTKFCGGCGTVNEVPETSQSSPAPPAVKKISNTHIGIAVCGAIAVVALIIILSVALGGGGADGTIRRYVNAMGTFDYYRAQRYHAFDVNEVLDQVLAANDMSMSEFNAELLDSTGASDIRAFYRDLANEISAEVSEMFGRNVRFSHEIISYRQLNPQQRLDEINRVRNALNNVGINMDDLIRTDRMHEMVTYTVGITLSGSLGEESDRETILMVRIGRNWYVWENPLEMFWDLPRNLRF